ncbi:MAG: tRNA (guanosine(37)-N1)-methyltransferase TrmD [Candidatus Omnitrophota bacterium]|nr:tRNA (guanosine(37)-N1)-methyltransferase TrmD [Candidatus Omnitrophota bacterium]
MTIDILTLFPRMFDSVLSESMLKRAQAKGKLKIKIHDLRDWTADKHRTADDKPFGGGPGMVMKVEPVFEALIDIGVREFSSSRVRALHPRTRKPANPRTKNAKVILLTPQGKKLDQKIVKKLAKEKSLTLICGHYEGVDERIRGLVDEEISIGDYILTCGEIPALVLIDALARLIPGVLGEPGSLKSESFDNNLLEYPQWTRPADYRGMKVPQVLLSGDHKRIERWRREEAVKRTWERRPDLLKSSDRISV